MYYSVIYFGKSNFQLWLLCADNFTFGRVIFCSEVYHKYTPYISIIQEQVHRYFMEHHMRIWHSRPVFSYMIKSYLLLHVKLLWKICILQVPRPPKLLANFATSKAARHLCDLQSQPPPPRPSKPTATSATSKAVAAPTYSPPRKFKQISENNFPWINLWVSITDLT